MDIIYARGEAAAAEVHEALPDAPSYSAVRTLLRILEEKGHLKHREDGPRYVFAPKVSRDSAKKSALHHLMHTFFEGSAAKLVSTLVSEDTGQLSPEELAQLATLIEKARTEGK